MSNQCVRTSVGTIRTPPVRLSGPYNVWKPNDKGKFTLRLLFKKGADLTLMKEDAAKVAEEKFGVNWKNMGLKSPFHDQGEKNYEGYEPGAIFVNVSSGRPPGVMTPSAQITTDQNVIYPGCWAYVTVNAFAYDVDGNKGIAFGLNNIQKVEDAERFGGGPANPEDEFAPIEGAETSEGDGGASPANLFD